MIEPYLSVFLFWSNLLSRVVWKDLLMIFAFPKGISKMLKFFLCSIVPLALTAANFLLCFHWRYVFHSEGKLVGGKLFFCICQVVNFSFFTGSFDKAIGKGFINAWLRSLPFTVHFISKGNSNHAPLQSETSEGRAGLGGWEQDVRYGGGVRGGEQGTQWHGEKYP